MRKIAITVVAIVLGVSLARAQTLPYGGWVGVYADQDRTTCNLVDAGGFVQLYYFHLDSPGAIAIEFKSDVSATVNWTSFGDQSPFPLKMGSFDSGVSISYGSCLLGDFPLGSTAYAVSGQTPACTVIQIEPHPIPSVPGATTPIAQACPSTGGGFLMVLRGGARVNDDGSCTCLGSKPVEETSWGKVKALYNR